MFFIELQRFIQQELIQHKKQHTPMRKFLFYFSSFCSLFLLVNVMMILIDDFQRLTEYGFGYLTGKILLLLLFLSIAIITGIKIFKQSKKDYF